MPSDAKQDKMAALEIALGRIEKDHGKGAVMRLGEEAAQRLSTEVISTGSLALDIALGAGGIPRGRITEVYGSESAGKSTLAIHIMTETQKKGGIAAYVDAEHALDPAYAANCGLDLKELAHFPARQRRAGPGHHRAGWCGAAPWIPLWWTAWPPWCRKRKSRGIWATPTSACKPA